MIFTIALAISTAFLIVLNAYKDREIYKLQDELAAERNMDNTLVHDVAQAYEEYGVECPLEGDKERR